MKRTLLTLLLVLQLVICLPLQVSAAVSSMVIDDADLLTHQEQLQLEGTAQALRDAYRMDVVIVTVDALQGKTAQQYADDFFDDGGYGYAEDASGILFLLAMEEREWYISTSGEGIFALTDYGIEQLGSLVLPYLSGGDYYGAFSTYLQALPTYLDAYQQGQPIDGYAESYHPGHPEEVVYYEEPWEPNILLSLAVGIVTAAVIVGIMAACMNTKRQQHGAFNYMKAGSFHLMTHQDLFLYSNVSKARRQQNTSGGGGSSVHRSSGGRRHGGGGGKF